MCTVSDSAISPRSGNGKLGEWMMGENMKVENIQHKLISTGKASALASGEVRNELELMCGPFPELSGPPNCEGADADEDKYVVLATV